MYAPNKFKQLSREQREAIEEMLNFSCSFKHIGNQIDKDPTTISKEVKRNGTSVEQRGELACANIRTCALRLSSTNKQCPKDCHAYSMPTRQKLKKPPFICNACKEKAKCRRQKTYYRAKEAEACYKFKLIDSCVGINLDDDSFVELDRIVSSGVKLEQAPGHICHTQTEKLPVSERTVYRYFDNNLFSVCNIDLPRKVRYKLRKKAKPQQSVKKVIENRDYVAYQDYLAKNPEVLVVEGGTVYGSTKTTLLTFHFCVAGFMISRIMPDRKQKSVDAEIDKIEELLSSSLLSKRFSELFPLLLVDNGKEFDDTEYIETGIDGKQRTKVFYCDPYSSYQKPHVEKNHEHIRQILSKRTNFDGLTQDDINKMMSHINSYARESLVWKTTYEVFTFFFGTATAQALGIIPIAPEAVCLKPVLLKSHKGK